MLTGEYAVVVLDAAGNRLAEIARSATTGHPSIGEEILIEGRTYTVERVRHVDDPDAHSTRVYTTAYVYVRIRAARVGDRSPQSERPTSSPVLPFSSPGPGDRVRSFVLPPALVAAVVACGYRAQATYFKAQHRVANRLVRDSDGWFLERLTPDELWRWSRRAKRHCIEAQALIDRCEAAAISSDPPSVVLSPSLAYSLRTGIPKPPSARPDLRLV